MSGDLHVHVGGGVERRTAHHQEQAAIREALESGTAATVVPSEDKHSTLQDSSGSCASVAWSRRQQRTTAWA